MLILEFVLSNNHNKFVNFYISSLCGESVKCYTIFIKILEVIWLILNNEY